MAVSISQDFLRGVHSALDSSLDYALTKRGVRHGLNAYAPHALPAYVLVTAAVEAFLYESILSDTARLLLKDSPLWRLQDDCVEKMDLRSKLVLAPQLLFGTTFQRGTQPFQDFDLVVRIRNDLAHYKMRHAAPKYIQNLADRGIALSAHGVANGGVDYEWPFRLSCTEGIRWAHNTACSIVRDVVRWAPEPLKGMIAWAENNFQPVGENEVRKWLADQGVDVTTSDPPQVAP